MDSFKTLGNQADTDKVTHHGYDRFYPQFLDRLRDISGAILEIGIHRHYSLKLWLNYFQHAFIYGIDIDVELEDERARVFKADQSVKADLVRVLSLINRPVHFIIDDGSHIPEHQVDTFAYFFKYLLEPGGVYIVEDIETSYWKHGHLYGYPTEYGYKHKDSFIERAKPLIDIINSEFLNLEAKLQNSAELRSISFEVASLISTMTFGQNCVIFVKKTVEEMSYNGRAYRYGTRLN